MQIESRKSGLYLGVDQGEGSNQTRGRKKTPHRYVGTKVQMELSTNSASCWGRRGGRKERAASYKRKRVSGNFRTGMGLVVRQKRGMTRKKRFANRIASKDREKLVFRGQEPA